jgi:hypothetical protein
MHDDSGAGASATYRALLIVGGPRTQSGRGVGGGARTQH